MSFLKKEKSLNDFIILIQEKLEQSHVVNEPDINVAYDAFSECLLSSINIFPPIRNSKVKRTNVNAPWFCKELKNAILKRNKLHKIWKLDVSNIENKNNFHNKRKNVEIMIRKLKKEYYFKKFNNCIGDSRQVFKLLNEINGKQKGSSKVPTIQLEGTNVSDPHTISNAFNDYFATIGLKLAKKKLPVAVKSPKLKV